MSLKCNKLISSPKQKTMPLSVLFIQQNQQERVRRLVSVASTAVGLLCYCHSTSFIHLFGEWNWSKFFLYSLFSFLACFAVLFQKAWTIIIPHQHEGLSRFLVATSTSIFLFFSDRASKGQSDAYGAISCVSFAGMSLSCGFNELLTVFTGALIVQLMGIKLILGAVAVVLCFIFIVPSPYLQRYLVIQDHHELQSIQTEHQVIVDIDSLLLPSIMEDQDNQRLIGVVEEDDEDQELMVVEVASSLQTNNEDEPQEFVLYLTQLILYLYYAVVVIELLWFDHFLLVYYLIHSHPIHLIVRYDVVSTTMELIIFIPEPQSNHDKWICKHHGRWLVTDVDHLLKNDLATSLTNILLQPVPACANFIKRFHKVLVSRMERLTSKAQNALKHLFCIFSFIDQWPTMKTKVLKPHSY